MDSNVITQAIMGRILDSKNIYFTLFFSFLFRARYNINLCRKRRRMRVYRRKIVRMQRRLRRFFRFAGRRRPVVFYQWISITREQPVYRCLRMRC